MKSILVVGGTGMLAALVRDLSCDAQVHVIARGKLELDLLAAQSKNIHSISVDYTNTSNLERELPGLSFDTVISWIHSNPEAREAAFVIAKHCTGDFFDITGSSGRDSSHASHSCAKEISRLKNVTYHRIVLGSKGDRWLTNNEICEGVHEALRAKRPIFIVGE